MQPGLVFVREANKLSVYALTIQGKPRPGTVLYRAPYYNIWDSGEVCQGTMPLPAMIHPSAIVEHEEAFFNSAFTHANSGTPARRKQEKLWSPRSFPIKALIKTKQRLRDL